MTTIKKASIYTVSIVTLIIIFLSLCNPNKENEIFVTIFLFGIAIIFSIFLSAFLIIQNLKN